MAAARLRLIAAIVILTAWQALASSGLLFRDVVPSLWHIASALILTLIDPAFYHNLRVTSGEFLAAVSIGGIAGAGAGLLLGANKFLAAAYERWVAVSSSDRSPARSPKPPMRKYIGMSMASKKM